MKPKTSKFTITTEEGKEKEITVNALTMRHASCFSGVIDRAQIPALLFDLMAPGALDIISPESYPDLLEYLMDQSSDFFERVAKTLTKVQAATKKREKAVKKSPQKSN